MTLNLVKGDFTELEDALRAQVQKLEEENNRLDEKIFLLDQENKLNVAELTELKTHNKLMLGMIADRDTKLITQKELINQLSGRIEELRSQLETPINFDDDDDE